jgi:Kdo2-lipid IVA 3' secondary acyltransferase
MSLKSIAKSRFFKWLGVKFLLSYLWILRKTCRIRVLASNYALSSEFRAKPKIYLTWHGRFAGLLTMHDFENFQTIASAHNDGDFIARILKQLGHQLIRGSSRKGRLDVIREILKLPKEDIRLFITPDGPKGPAFQVKGSVLNIAKKLDASVVIVMSSCRWGIKLKTWDRFLIPLPFTKVYISMSDPININDETSLQSLSTLMNGYMDSLDKVATRGVI